MAIKKQTAWDVANAQIESVFPYLREDDLTAQRYATKHGISKYTATTILDSLTDAGVLRKEARRVKGRGGHPTTVYVINGKGDDEQHFTN